METVAFSSDALYCYRWPDEPEETVHFADDAPELKRRINGEWCSPLVLRNTEASERWKEVDNRRFKEKQVIRSKQDTSYTQYATYVENKEFFDSSDFESSLKINPAECYWLAGWFEKRGSLENHDPILIDGDVVRRGATLHVIFPNPEFPGLDMKMGEFFDPYRKGWIMINSVSAYRFFENFSADLVPEEFHAAYQKGLEGILL